MKPKNYFDDVWQRCELFTTLYGYMRTNATVAIRPEELLRAEWASRVCALDLYVHELVAQGLVEIFEGKRPSTAAFAKFSVSCDALMRVQAASTASERRAAFDLEVRTKLNRMTFQNPDDIADGVRLISECKLWNEVAFHFGATQANFVFETKSIKKQLAMIVDRRNKLVHEGDLQPSLPRIPWPIATEDVVEVKRFIEGVVGAIDSIV
jgi:hypothetical protein